MDKQKITIIITVSAVIFALFAGFLLFKNDFKFDHTPEVRQAIKELQKSITTKHQYVDGMHTFLGNFLVPNACYNYKLKVNSVGSDRIIEINYIQPEITDCPVSGKSPKSFVSSFEAPENQSIKFIVNGESVDLNIIEVPEDQNIETFEAK